ncbi:hypothetical protein OC834_006098 [Tilletia horrida]|nr:hypothetical protein OC834_006098 [Tilletia horrida]KAK0523358.1 hypothetical protein OC835_006284 [Tilletia horrida]
MAGIYRRSTMPAQNLHPPFVNPAPSAASSKTASSASSSAAAPTSSSRSDRAAAGMTTSTSTSTGTTSSSSKLRSSGSRNSSREQHKDLTGRWLADDLCSNCGGPTQESRLYCSEECLRQELEAARRRESDQIAQAIAQHNHLVVQATSAQAQAFQAMADVDIDDEWDRKKQHRHSFPLPFAQPLPSAARMQESPSDRLPSSASALRSQRSGHSPSAHHYSEASVQLTASAIHAIETINEPASPYSRRKYSHIQRPRPPASDASSSSMASLPPPVLYRHSTSKSPNPAPREAPSHRSSSVSSLSSGQQRSSSGNLCAQPRSRSRSSTMSETTSTSDDAYTTGPGTPSPAIQPDGGIISSAALGFIHEDDAEPTLLSLPPSISSPSAVLLSQKSPSGGVLHGGKGAGMPASAALSHTKTRARDELAHLYSATYTAHRSPVLLPSQQYQQGPGRNGSKSQPGTPWRNNVSLPDPSRRSPAILPVLSPSTQGMRFARRPSSTAMPRTAVSAAMGVSSASAAAAGTAGLPSPFISAVSVGNGQHQFLDSHGYPISALSSPVLTPTSGGTASTTPTPSVGHIAGLTSSSMPHALSFFRPLTAVNATGPTTATANATTATAANQATVRGPPTGPNGMIRRNTRERVGLMTPAFPTTATATTTAQAAPTAAIISHAAQTVAKAGVHLGLGPVRQPQNRSRSHTTSSASASAAAAAAAAALVAARASDSASDFARSTSEEDNGGDDDDDVPSDFELDARQQHVEVRGRSQVAVASPATASGSATATLSSVMTAGSRNSSGTGRSSVTATVPAPELVRGRSRAQGERSSSRRGRSPPRAAARTDSSLTRLGSARAQSAAALNSRRPATAGNDATENAQMLVRKAAAAAATAVPAVSPAFVPRGRQDRGRSPTIPIRPASSVRRSPKLSPRAVIPQPQAEDVGLVHPSHALFGMGVGVGGGVAIANSVGRPQDREGDASSWERASPLAKFARQESEVEAKAAVSAAVAAAAAAAGVSASPVEERGRGRSRGRSRSGSQVQNQSTSQVRGRGRVRSAGGANGVGGPGAGAGAPAPMEQLRRVSSPMQPRMVRAAMEGGRELAEELATGPADKHEQNSIIKVAGLPSRGHGARPSVDPGFDDVDLDIDMEC